MARIRSIKPEFWTDEKLTECSLSARLLFIGLLNFADDFGNMERSAKRIKMQIFPADVIDCEPLILELIEQHLLTEYSVSKSKYLHINGFSKHQRINRLSRPLHPLPEHSVSTQTSLTECSFTEKEKEKEKEKEEKELPDGNSKKPTGKKIGLMKPEDVSEQVFSDFLALRAKKKAPVTATVIDGFRREAEKAGISLQEAMAISCKNGWQGFEADWINKASAQRTTTLQNRKPVNAETRANVGTL